MAFVFMSVLTCAGFTIFPNLATYMVYNVGLTEQQLPFIYLTGGLCTVFSMNWIGRWADRAGKVARLHPHVPFRGDLRSSP